MEALRNKRTHLKGTATRLENFLNQVNNETSLSIHNNNSLAAAQKFQYLKGLLKDEPANLIRHLQVTDQSYEEALMKLQERYDKPSLVVDSFIETFLYIPKADNTASLRHLSNVADEVVRGLRAQGADAEKRDPWLIHILSKKIDRESLQAWAEHCGKVLFPSLDSFITFINKRCDALERLPSTNKHLQKSKSIRAYTSNMKKGCVVCTQNHHLSYCPTFNRVDTSSRIEIIKEKNLCFNCLKPNHRVQNCPSRITCEVCHGHHHSLIHLEHKPPANSSTKVKKPEDELTKKPAAANTTFLISEDSSVNLSTSSEVNYINMLLPTARVVVKDNMGYYQSCNILLDSGCQNTLISEKCAQRLTLVRSPSKIYVSYLANMKAGATRGKVQLEVKSVHSEEIFFMQAHVFNNLTSKLPCTNLIFNFWDDLKNLPLADNKFYIPKYIDIIIGFDYFFSFIKEGSIWKNGNLVAQNTAFGWVVCSGCSMEDSFAVFYTMNYYSPEEDINHSLRLFWEIERVCYKEPSLTKDDQRAEDYYRATTLRDKRYSVRLPFKHKPELGISYNAAVRRLQAMERKFKSNIILKDSYSEFMREYLNMGHMELIPKDEINRPAAEIYYLPHHAVLKDSSITTKLRVVFDGSSKTSNGKSLNDNLLKGPILQQDLVAVILRYRCKKYCFSADIKQMFGMIDVQKCDRDYQRILWREDSTDEIQHYRLTTVTYGTTPAPYLSIRTLLQLSEDEREHFPLASEALKTSFYVDDCMAGSNTIEDAAKLAEQLNELLTAGGFQLRKWDANNSSVLRKIPDSDKLERIVKIPTDITICLLGVIWKPDIDCFSYKVKNKDYCLDTKRKLLSEISKIFDPLGWISPVIIAVKIIIQKNWLLSLDWDEHLSSDIKSVAEQFFSEFYLLNNIIPRIIFSTESIVTYHGFCDASKAAYAAVVYCRKTSADGITCTNIVMAKTKVPPLTVISIPLLELCAAYLLTQLFEYLIPVLSIKVKDITCWSDSKTVLAWLSSHPSKWKTFVAHRTHRTTKLNPADCASRGVRSSYLVEDEMWFKGPPFLLHDSSEWPKSIKDVITDEELHVGKLFAFHNATTSKSDDTPLDVCAILNKRISNFQRMIRVLAYCYRAVKFLKSKSGHNLPLHVDELNHAEYVLYKYHQNLEFLEQKVKKIITISDEHGILRVGGRLSNADLPYDSQHQIILSKDCPITFKIVHACHLSNMHAGVTLMILTLRQKYWIVGARELVKRVYRSLLDQLMGDLPKFRVNAAYPFYEVGCDYAGPIMYKLHNGRKAPIVKAYVAVFICLVTKDIHLELVSDLSSDAFLAALDRFVARRGLCGHIHSDNGTNFQGAAKKLGEIYKLVKSFEFNTNVSNFLSSKDENLPPACWKLGRVIETHAGSDGLVRDFYMATIKTETSTFKRPITKLYPLPKED
ncbi:hypothetical protein CVS40_8789 [Lucilia cuprina]|nr:hypothetical protein CVS40_8789 [Lucilia cuprina]